MIVIGCFFLACTWQNNTFPQRDEEKEVKKDSANKVIFIPDISIGKKLFLLHPLSVENLLGNIMAFMDKDADFPFVYMLNNIGDEYLKMTFYPGDEANSMSLFEVGWSNALTIKIEKRIAPFDSFTTENGISLGMNKDDLLRIKGDDCSITDDNDMLLIKYIVDDFETSEFLRRYNMPVYFANYWIKENKIVKYQFGFEYP